AGRATAGGEAGGGDGSTAVALCSASRRSTSRPLSVFVHPHDVNEGLNVHSCPSLSLGLYSTCGVKRSHRLGLPAHRYLAGLADCRPHCATFGTWRCAFISGRI